MDTTNTRTYHDVSCILIYSPWRGFREFDVVWTQDVMSTLANWLWPGLLSYVWGLSGLMLIWQPMLLQHWRNSDPMCVYAHESIMQHNISNFSIFHIFSIWIIYGIHFEKYSIYKYIHVYIHTYTHSTVFQTRVGGKYRASCLPSNLFRFKLCRCAWAARQAQCLAYLVQLRAAQSQELMKSLHGWNPYRL